MLKGFRDFLLKQNVMSLAVAVVIGAAVGKVVTGIVDDVIMPVIGLVLPGGDWRSASWTLSGTAAIKYGDLLGRLLDFTAVAFIVFLALRWLERFSSKPEPTQSCPACLETVPAAAKRCKACGEPLAGRGRPLEPVGGP